MSRLGALHITKHTGAKHTATVIFFHGSGSSGADIKEWARALVNNFSYPHIKIMYPTSPIQPYTPAGGQMSTVWFDRQRVEQNVPEKMESLAKIEVEVKNLIKKENDAGIPSNRIIVGGFSMGGALAYHTAYRWEQNVAGVFAFSSFLNNNSAVYQELKNAAGKSLAPLLLIHGDGDTMVPVQWAHATFDQLKGLGVNGEMILQPRLGHSINRRGIMVIKEWVDKLLPEI